jgi:hypothetical protein
MGKLYQGKSAMKRKKFTISEEDKEIEGQPQSINANAAYFYRDDGKMPTKKGAAANK